MTIFVGADLASSSGLCYGRPHTTPVAETYRAPVCGDDYSIWGLFWLKRFCTLLRALAARLEPGEAIIANYEAPLLPRAAWDSEKEAIVQKTNLQTTRKLHSLGVLFETACAMVAEELDVVIDCREANLKSIKRELSGSGSADKMAMVFVARKAGIVLPDGPDAKDAADAVGAWYLAVRHHAPEHLPYWDKRIHGHGGQERLSATQARTLFSRK